MIKKEQRGKWGIEKGGERRIEYRMASIDRSAEQSWGLGALGTDSRTPLEGPKTKMPRIGSTADKGHSMQGTRRPGDIT